MFYRADVLKMAIPKDYCSQARNVTQARWRSQMCALRSVVRNMRRYACKIGIVSCD